MGRIVAQVSIENVFDRAKSVRLDALVDTGSAYMVLPNAWRDRLGDLEAIRTVDLETATQEVITGDVCGPVRLQIEGFTPVFSEVLFIDMSPANGDYEPLIGYLPLEQSQIAVDMLGHRLVPVKHVDLKLLS